MKKKYIMLIDDDPDESEFFLNALEKIPGLFEFGYALSANAALSLLKEVTPDYFFVDMNMPAVNGLECISMLKKTDKAAEKPAFIYTTGYDATLHKQALNHGAAGCVRKPSQPKALVEMLKHLFETGSPEVKR
jgi:CheY-like chemotaxis protein